MFEEEPVSLNIKSPRSDVALVLTRRDNEESLIPPKGSTIHTFELKAHLIKDGTLYTENGFFAVFCEPEDCVLEVCCHFLEETIENVLDELDMKVAGSPLDTVKNLDVARFMEEYKYG